MKAIRPDTYDQRPLLGFSTIFLAGSIDNGKASMWADEVQNALQDLDVSLFNPRKINWDSNLVPRMSEPLFAQQVNWELDHIDSCDVVFFYFEPGSVSPITLQELGYVIGSKKNPIVCCPDGFWRKGNVEVMLHRAKIDLYHNLSDAIQALRNRVLHDHTSMQGGQ